MIINVGPVDLAVDHSFVVRRPSRAFALFNSLLSRHTSRRSTVRLGKLGLAAILQLLAMVSVAQEIEPRLYSNAPVGVNFLVAGFVYTDGNVAVEPTVPLDDARIDANTALVAYARSLGLFGKSAKFDVTLPYAWTSGSALLMGNPVSRKVDGLLDPSLRFSINLHGAPALGVQEFAAYQQDLIVGFSLKLRAPLGQYDADRLVNNGTNRWSVKPELGLSKAVGAWRLEMAGAVEFFSDNSDYLSGGRLEQEPVYSIQAHAVYNLPSGSWLALATTYYTGGRTTTNDLRGQNLQENSRVGLTYAVPLGSQYSLKLYGSTGVSTRTGTDFDLLGMAVQYRWGGRM